MKNICFIFVTVLLSQIAAATNSTEYICREKDGDPSSLSFILAADGKLVDLQSFKVFEMDACKQTHFLCELGSFKMPFMKDVSHSALTVETKYYLMRVMNGAAPLDTEQLRLFRTYDDVPSDRPGFFKFHHNLIVIPTYAFSDSADYDAARDAHVYFESYYNGSVTESVFVCTAKR